MQLTAAETVQLDDALAGPPEVIPALASWLWDLWAEASLTYDRAIRLPRPDDPVTPRASVAPQPPGRTREQLTKISGRPEHRTCRKCSCPIDRIGGAWVVTDTGTTADGLSYCPPDPDAGKVGNHIPRKER